MTIRTLLLHAAPDSGFKDRLACAISMARQYGASLHALYTLYPAGVPRVGRALSIYVKELMREAQEKEAAERELFEAAVAAAGIKADWRVVEGEVTHELRRASDYADLVVVSETTQGTTDDELAAILPEHLALSATAPVIIVPTGRPVPARFGRVLVAWKPSREAGHAVRLGLPLITAADQVRVLTIGEGDTVTEAHGLRLGQFLARHGANVDHQHLTSGSPATAIANAAQDWQADLLVLGAYSRSRIAELVLGGVTASLIAHPPVALLATH